jgi:hypothetical protein
MLYREQAVIVERRFSIEGTFQNSHHLPVEERLAAHKTLAVRPGPRPLSCDVGACDNTQSETF